MSDSLIRKAQAGDEEAFVALYRKYLPLVLRMKTIYFIRNYEHEDWEQEARIALYHALNTYSTQRGVSFGSYYKRITQNQIYSILRKQNAIKRRDQKEEVSIEQKISNEGTDFLAEYATQEPLAIQQILIKEAVASSELKLSKREAQVLLYYVEGKEFKEIEQLMCIELNQVLSAYARVKTKIIRQLKQYRLK